MIKTLKQLMYLMAMTSALASNSSALPLLANGSAPFTFFGVAVDTPGAYAPDTQFTVGSVMVSNNGTGSFACPSLDCVAVGSSASITSPFFGDALAGLILTFGPANRYSYTVTGQLAPDITHNGLNTADNLFTLGLFHDTAGTFQDAAASLVFSFTESCSGTAPCSESGSATFATPPAALPSPEPAALFLTGSALLGLGFARRKSLA